MSTIAIGGIWHQGMVLAAGLASIGHDVRGICPADVAAELQAGRPLLHEPGVGELLSAGVAAGRLSFTDDARAALEGADFAFVSNDTPVDDEDVPVLDAVFAVADAIADGLTDDPVLVVTAQVPVGTTVSLAERVAARSGRTLRVAYVPEFLRLGVALETLLEADRFVVGAGDAATAEEVAAVYEPFGRPIVQTTIPTAEMAKHASNAFLATSVSFANEIADLCDAVGASASDIAGILRLDRRIGRYAYLEAGLGFAGATLGRDLRALQRLASAHGRTTPLVDAVLAVNGDRPLMVVRRLDAALGGLEGRRVGLLGLTYKAGTSTLRRAVSFEIAAGLADAGAAVTGYDPLADLGEAAGPLPLEICEDPFAAAGGADAVVLVTGWEGVESLDLVRLRGAAAGDFLLDTRGAIAADAAARAGFRYERVGG